MAFVITQPCIGSKDTSCVEVCPVDCIAGDASSDQYFIDPRACINCAACVDACPVGAIFEEDEVPGQWRHFIAMNLDYFQRGAVGA